MDDGDGLQMQALDSPGLEGKLTSAAGSRGGGSFASSRKSQFSWKGGLTRYAALSSGASCGATVSPRRQSAGAGPSLQGAVGRSGLPIMSRGGGQ